MPLKMIQLFIFGPQVSLDFRDSHSFLAHKCRSNFFLAHKCRSIELFKNVNRVISVIQKVLDYSFLAHKCRSPQVSLDFLWISQKLCYIKGSLTLNYPQKLFNSLKKWPTSVG